MKILAIIDVAPTADLGAVRTRLAEEVRGSWELYTSGVLREAYATSSPSRVVFVLEADTATAAGEHLARLPLVASGAIRFELVELRPFANWAILFERNAAPTMASETKR